MRVAHVRKALVALSGLGAVIALVLEDSVLTLSEGINVGVAALTAVGVYLAKNESLG